MCKVRGVLEERLFKVKRIGNSFMEDGRCELSVEGLFQRSEEKVVLGRVFGRILW